MASREAPSQPGAGGQGGPVRSRRVDWRRWRVPAAIVCICGGLAGLGMPVWSGWWYAHVQSQQRRTFQAQVRALGAGTGGSAAASAGAAGSSGSSDAVSVPTLPALPPPPAPGASSLLPGAAALGAAVPVRVAVDVGSGDPLAEVDIPAIGVDSTVLEGLTYDPSVWSALLRDGPAHVQGSPLPGQPGRMVIFGHLNIWGAVFLHLSQLRPGDQIDFVTAYGNFEYRVTGSQVIAPTDLAAVAPTHSGPATVDLVTCNGLFDQQRLVVEGTLVGQPLGGSA